MSYENILVEKKNAIAYVTVNRPKVLNALNRKTVEELRDALLDARNDEGVRVLIADRWSRFIEANGLQHDVVGELELDRLGSALVCYFEVC
jgi:1,4-dihydroxy-2-naphthoyl-CoA synthase